MTLKIVACIELKRSGVIVAVRHNIKLQHTTDHTPSLSHIHNKIISFLYIILVSEWFDLKGWEIWVHKIRYWRASYEDRKVSGHVYVFQWYRISLFLVCGLWHCCDDVVFFCSGFISFMIRIRSDCECIASLSTTCELLCGEEGLVNWGKLRPLLLNQHVVVCGKYLHDFIPSPRMEKLI